MSQVKDFLERTAPEPDDFTYLISNGNTDFKILIKTLLGELIKGIVTATYELVLEDQYHTIRMTFAGNKDLTVPIALDVPFVSGTVIRIRNSSPSLSTLIPATIGVTLNTKGGLNIVPWGEVKLVSISPDVWDVIGDLTT